MTNPKSIVDSSMTKETKPQRFVQLPNKAWVSPAHVTGIITAEQKEFLTSTVPPRVIVFVTDHVETINVDSIEEAEIMANELIEILNV